MKTYIMLDKYNYRHMTHSHWQLYKCRSLYVDLLDLFLVMNLFVLYIAVQRDELKDSTEMKWQLHDSEKIKINQA